MLANEPEQRYQLVREIHTDLVALQQDTGSAAVLAGQIQRTRPAKWQISLPWAVVTVVALLAFWRPWESSPEPARLAAVRKGVSQGEGINRKRHGLYANSLSPLIQGCSPYSAL